MIFIAHRGNYDGKHEDLENEPNYVQRALDAGYHVEVDVWWHEDQFYLGHDEPQFPVETEFLQDIRVWCHAKSHETLNKLQHFGGTHYFWHQQDDLTLTSLGFLWYHPNTKNVSGHRAIWMCDRDTVSPALIKKMYGICMDRVPSWLMK